MSDRIQIVDSGVDGDLRWLIIVDTHTGVQYIVRHGETSNDMTPLLNADGTLDLHPVYIEEHKSEVDGKPVVSSTKPGNAPTRLNIPIDKRFTIIDAKCSVDDQVIIKLKIHNNTDFEYRSFDFMISSYDGNGDRYYDSIAQDFDVEPHHSGWTDKIYTKMPLLEFGSIKIHSYYDKNVDEYELDPKPEVKLEDMQMVDDIG